MLDRRSILRDAHSRARWAFAAGGRTYRACLAEGLRASWAAYKDDLADCAAAALPADVVARVAELRLIASTQNFTSFGAAQFRALNAMADEAELAARCSIITAQDHSHHAH